MRRPQDGRGNSHRSAVAPFLDHGPHIVLAPRCNSIVSCIQGCVNNVDTMHNLLNQMKTKRKFRDVGAVYDSSIHRWSILRQLPWVFLTASSNMCPRSSLPRKLLLLNDLQPFILTQNMRPGRLALHFSALRRPAAKRLRPLLLTLS